MCMVSARSVSGIEATALGVKRRYGLLSLHSSLYLRFLHYILCDIAVDGVASLQTALYRSTCVLLLNFLSVLLSCHLV